MGCGPSEPAQIHVNYQGMKRPTQGPSQAQASAPKQDTYNYPPPLPPTTKKADIFHLEDYAEIDQHASKVPIEHLYDSVEALVNYLTSVATSDLGRVRALFKFITSIDVGSMQNTLASLPDPGTPLDYLLKIQWQMGNHAFLFATLCRAIDIPCVIISGMNKSSAYQLGGKLDRRALGAQWNAVLVDGQWRLLDLLWASTCVVGGRSGEWALIGDEDEDADDDLIGEEEGETQHQVNEFFFLTDPDVLIYTHLPNNDIWQLLQQPITTEEFESRLYARERFFQLPLHMIKGSLQDCILQAKEGSVDIEFGTSMESRKAELRFLLYRQRQSRRESVPHFPLEQYVLFQKTVHSVMYHVQFPVSGRFKMDIFGRVPGKHETFDLICSYLVDCASPKPNAAPLPDNPDIGWGPGPEAEDAGLKAKTHTDAAIEAKDGTVEIKFDMKNPLTILQNLKHNELHDWLLRKYAIMYEENGELVIKLRLPDEGQYALNLFGDDKNKEGDLANVCNYLINSTGSSEQSFPKVPDGTLGKSHLADNFNVKPKATATGGAGSSSLLKSKDGTVNVTLDKAPDVELFCEVSHPDLNDDDLAAMVSQAETDSSTSFHVNFSKKGEYALNIFAKKKGDKNRVYHVYSYMVESEMASGEAKAAEEAEEETPVIPVQTTSDTAVITVPGKKGKLVAELRRKNAADAPRDDHVEVRHEGDDHVFKVAVPVEGEYDLCVYEKKENGSLAPVSTYHIWRMPEDQQQQQISQKEDVDPEELERRKVAKQLEAKHKAARDQLRTAVASGDVGTIQAAIQDYEARNIPDKGDIEKAKNALQYIQITEKLSSAMSRRRLGELEKVLAGAQDAPAPVKARLALQLQMAQRIQEQLSRIEKLRHAILNLNQKTVAEIKSYSQPPAAVNTVMAATFLLLGDPESDLKDWRSVQILMGKTGKGSLKRRVKEFSVEDLSINVAVATRRLLSKLDLGEVRDVSAGAATFYVWSMGMVEECESRFQQAGGDLQSLQ